MIFKHNLCSPLILASASPRRVSLLADIGITPDGVSPSSIDEVRLDGETPRAMSLRLARAKALDVSEKFPEAIIIAADTVVACGSRVLPKAKNNEDVARCLSLLSGRRHRVFTGLCVVGPETIENDKKRHVAVRCSENVVLMRRLLPEDISLYVGTGEGIGKAGGYAIQGHAAAYIRFISGAYSGIVGLPLYEVAQLFARYDLTKKECKFKIGLK